MRGQPDFHRKNNHFHAEEEDRDRQPCHALSSNTIPVKMVHSLLALALLSAFSPALAAPCATAFDSARDYYAGASFAPRYATTFSISYARNYKVITVKTAANVTTTMTVSVCGAPLPSRAALGLPASSTLVQLSLPLTAAIASATYASFIELLGARSSLSAVAGASYFNSACIRKLVSAGAVADVANAWGGFDETAAAVGAAGVAFGGTGAWDTLSVAHAAPVDETEEAHPLGVAEYLYFFAAFFDKEATASHVFSSIASRYMCTAEAVMAAVAQAPATPQVLWGYRFATDAEASWYVASCPGAWYCPLVAAAGGNVLTAAGGSTQLTDAEFANLAATATHFVYTGSDWDANIAPTISDAASAVGAVLRAIPAVKSKQVFDILGSGVNAWFAERSAAPDAVLQDFFLALQPAAAAKAGVKGPAVFLRNVFTASAGSPAAADSCADTAAPTSLLSVNTCPAAAAAAGVQTLSTPQIGAIAGTLGGALVVAAVVGAAWAVSAAKASAAAAAATAKLTAVPAASV